MNLDIIKDRTTWNDASESINFNFSRVGGEVDRLASATYKNMGYFLTAEALRAAYPTASAGARAYVGSTYPYAIYLWDEEANDWVDSGEVGGDESIPLGEYYTKDEIDMQMAKKQDELHSGVNIKTVNGESLLGEGNISISGAGGCYWNKF